MQGYGHSLYQLRVDPPVVGRSHAPWILEPRAGISSDAPPSQYATWMRHIDATPYRQKRLRFSVSAKTAGATARGDFWARAKTPQSPIDGVDLVGEFKRMPADSDWVDYVIVFDVPEEASSLEYGVGTSPFGRVWFDQPRVETVDRSVSVTTAPKSRP